MQTNKKDLADLEDIRLHITEELVPDRKLRKKFMCPLCGSGSRGGDSDGAFRILKDGIHGKCDSCGFRGDIFDLVSQRDGLSLSEATKALVDKYGRLPARPAKPAPRKETSMDQKPKSFSEYIAACHKDLPGSPAESYLLNRGITKETMERFRLGYGTDQFRHPCVVIPHDPAGRYYTTRVITDSAKPKFCKPEGVSVTLFNTPALRQDAPCFVVESQLCAISIAQVGGNAVALGGIGMEEMLLSLLAKNPPAAPLILSLDNDQPRDGKPGPGPAAQAKLAAGLREKGILFLEINISGECKDPNELLQKDPDALRQNVAAAMLAAVAAQATVHQNELDDYEALTTSASFSEFEDYLAATAGRPPIPTGYKSLDQILNGGMTPGLYIMGAISSLGKTSWMLSIADHIAAAGTDVLYFSLEMSKYELIAKSVSRLSYMGLSKDAGSTLGDAFTTFEVLNCRNIDMPLTQYLSLRKAMDAYKDTIGKHMWIFSGIGSISADDVAQKVENHIRITGRKPVVFIDYLQILKPEDPRSTDKQNTDRAVVKLKTLSATHDIPVFCISSLNRTNYSEPINMAAFKESGAIEYGSDVLIGLQIMGMDRQPGEKDKEHSVRVIELLRAAEQNEIVNLDVKVLKNRNGKRGGFGLLQFHKKYNYFKDLDGKNKFISVTDSTPFDDDADSDDDGWEEVKR